MNMHKNARLTPLGRERIVRQVASGQTPQAAARATGVVNRHLGIGWEYVHVCIDDASRVAFVEVMADQRKDSAIAFLKAAVAYYANSASVPSA
jgi:hypothetical protein